jgi:hypothetical protein
MQPPAVGFLLHQARNLPKLCTDSAGFTSVSSGLPAAESLKSAQQEKQQTSSISVTFYQQKVASMKSANWPANVPAKQIVTE